MIRDILCKRCKQKISEEETVKTITPKLGKLCVLCKQVSLEKHKQMLSERNKNEKIRKINSNRLNNNNPMQNKDTRIKVSNTLKEKYICGQIVSSFSNPEKLKEIRKKWKITPEGSKSISDRMKLNNPMSNEITKQKMVATFKQKVKSGEIVYKHGPEHHLWQGNRSFADTVRCQLYPVWTYPCLLRDNFTCQNCTTQTNLTIHHKTPLRDLIKKAKEHFKIKDFSKIDSNLWQPYIDYILSLHTLEIGITLCKKCHSNEDKYYHS